MADINKDKFKELLGNTPEGNAFVDTFTAEDVLILQLYYKWVTCQVAKNAGIANLIESDEARRQMQEQYHASDWQFSGVIDHGYRGAATCSHANGHSLRHAYYAYSPSLNVELVFGRDCMSKFLGVNAAILGKLTQILENTDIEVRNAIAYGRNSTQLKNSTCYTMLYTLKTNQRVNELFVSILGRTATELFLNFINSGFVLPQRLNDMVTKAYNEVIQEVIWNGSSVTLFDKDFSKIKHDYPVTSIVLPNGVPKRLLPVDINKDMGIEVACQLGLRQLINCLSINSYTSGIKFMPNDADMEKFFTVLQEVNVLYAENRVELEKKYHVASRASFLQKYCSDSIDADSAEILLYCYIKDDTSLLCTLFNVTDVFQILGVFVRNVLTMIPLMKGVS